MFLPVIISIAVSLCAGEVEQPTTSLCYHYSRGDCETAKADASSTAELISNKCNIQTIPCTVPRAGHNRCLAIWRQDHNDSLPEHTDRTFENTNFMSCLNYPPQEYRGACQEDCVANTRTKIGNTSIVRCCCIGPLCNGLNRRYINITESTGDDTDVAKVETDSEENTAVKNNQYLITGLIIAFVTILICTSIGIVVVVKVNQRHKAASPNDENQELQEYNREEEEDLLQAGLSLQHEIAQGRYAKVYKGGCMSRVEVAIKCFTAAHRKMWQQEKDIYKMAGLAHPNVTQFFGAIQHGSGNDSTMWIVVEYHPNGSIYDYLKGHVLNWPDMLKLAHSMVKGLAFLHDDSILINGQHRWALAHRDIKSKNILVKSDMTAAIADFGLAQCFGNGIVNESHAQFQAGTHRYMAPEVLDGAISFTKDAFLRIDVYALALVLWELLTRCEVSENRSAEYKAPYEDMEVGRYTTLLETLQTVVSKEKKRPTFPDCLYLNPDASSLISTIEDSWDADSEARLSASCIEARLAVLLRSTGDGTEANNIRNLEPPPYDEHPPTENASLLIGY